MTDQSMYSTPSVVSSATTSHIVALGDGGSGLPAQQRIAAQLARHYEQQPFQTVLLLGDNIYPNGDTIRYGEQRFTQLYRPLLEQGVQFIAILGNHDVSGPLGVGYPTFWRSNRKENMRFFNMSGRYYDLTLGPLHLFMLDTTRFDPIQRQWLRTQLAAHSSHPWKIVCGHHPVFSSGFHGSSARLKRRLKPILEAHAVPLYLSAHEHDYERFEPINQVTYLISGGGGANLRKFGKPRPGSIVRQAVHHFLSLQWEADGLSIQAINETGQIIDQCSINAKPGK